MVDRELLKFLVCPQSHVPLRLADEQLLRRLNRAIASGRIVNASGRIVDAHLTGGLLCDDNALLYPVVDDIPVLLAEEAIPLDQIEGDIR